MSDTVGRGGDAGGVRDGGDSTEGLRGLRVGHDLAVLGVSTGEVLVITLARLEGTVLGVVGSVVVATDTIVDVLAEVGSVGAVGVAGLEAEGVAAHEAVMGQIEAPRDVMRKIHTCANQSSECTRHRSS